MVDLSPASAQPYVYMYVNHIDEGALSSALSLQQRRKAKGQGSALHCPARLPEIEVPGVLAAVTTMHTELS